MEKCNICGSSEMNVLYEGTIRMGGANDISTETYKVYQCAHCKAAELPSIIEDQDKFYESDEYRKQIGQNNEEDVYEKRHDPEVRFYFEMIPLAEYRGLEVADLGCGAGSFLDAIKGFAKKTIGVEKNKDFVDLLNNKGHVGLESLSDHGSEVDMAVSHSVIEHLSDPLSFIKEIYENLKPGGKALISTPNQAGFLMQNGPEQFKSFFYRKVHNFYFNPESLKNLMLEAGFKNVEIRTIQNYGLSNSLLWLKNGRGSGNTDILNSDTLDFHWKQYLESNLLADRVYCIAEK